MGPQLDHLENKTRRISPDGAWGVIALSLLLCLGLALLHVAQRRLVDRTLADLDRLRQARIELSHGFFDVTLGRAGTPFQRPEGVLKVSHAVTALQAAAAELPPHEAALIPFDSAVESFRVEMSDWLHAEPPDSLATLTLFRRYHALEEATDRLTDARRTAMIADARRLDLFLFVALGSGILLFLGIGWAAVIVARRQSALEGRRREAELARSESEAHLGALADALPQVVWIAGVDGRPIYMNRRANELAGGNPDLNWPEVIHPDDHAPMIAGWTEALTAGRPYQGEFRLRGPGTGEYRWHLARGVPVANGPGGSLRWYCTATDIHAQKLSEADLRESQERYRHLVEFLPDALFINVGGRIVFCNPACVRLVGARSEADLIGHQPFDFFAPDCHALIRRRIGMLQETGQPAPLVEMTVQRLDGRPVPVRVSATPLMDAGLSGILVVLHDLTERKRIDEMLHLIMENTVEGIITIDQAGRVTSFNRAAERIFGYAADEVLGRNVNRLMPNPHREAHDGYMARYLETGQARIIGVGRELEGLRPDGSLFPIELSVTEFSMQGARYFIGIVRDISERKKLEEQLRQSQKMEAIGQVAGGVAHDFNNLLTVISGYSELLLSRLPEGDPSVPHIRSISKAGELAASLTRQLLVFSRRGVLEPRVLDLNGVVGETEKLLRRVIGEDIRLTTTLAPDLGRVRVDHGYMVQVLMNLVVNARDAMPTGGQLTIETANVQLGAEYVATTADVSPGPHALLSVTDTGCGMAPEVLAHVFEPFFTTKGVGRGTGLGLAVVHGLVKQSGGHLTVYSEPGVGTTFKLYFPHAAETGAPRESAAPEPDPRGTETILLVEDDERVRELATHALEANGYRVLPAADGAEALTAAGAHADPIHLLLTDVVMPGMSGRELAEALLPRRTGLRLLYVSGYTDDAIVRHGILHAEVDFLQKPYTPQSLLRRVRQVLDRPAAPPPPPPGSATA